MPTLVVRPTTLDHGLYRASYDELLEDLQRRGFDAYLDRPPEQRDAGLSLAAADVMVTVAEHLGDHAIDVILGAVVMYLGGKVRSKRRAKRHAAIFGPDGELLREVELPDQERDDDE
jgi:hypothetical protein